MNGKRFFLHSGHARIAEICFMVVGLMLLVALGHAAMNQVAAKESIIGIQEWLWGRKEDSLTAPSDQVAGDHINETLPVALTALATTPDQHPNPSVTSAQGHKDVTDASVQAPKPHQERNTLELPLPADVSRQRVPQRENGRSVRVVE